MIANFLTGKYRAIYALMGVAYGQRRTICAQSKKTLQTYRILFGFNWLSSPCVQDPTPVDMALWTPDSARPITLSDLSKIKHNLGLIGDRFFAMVQEERKCLSLHLGPKKAAAWKRPVRGVREMCDVCKTTLFNHHWICELCGMYICLDCYWSTDDFMWPECTTGNTPPPSWRYTLPVLL